jgi:hypothetical protein
MVDFILANYLKKTDTYLNQFFQFNNFTHLNKDSTTHFSKQLIRFQ